MSDEYRMPAEQDPETAVVPAHAEFSEEMNLLLHLAKNYPDELTVSLYAPVSQADIDSFEAQTQIRLTDELKDFYLFTNGIMISAANLDLSTLSQVGESLEEEWEWGDEKRRILLGEMIGDGELIFYDADCGKIIANDHGDETEYSDLTMLFAEIILDFIHGEIDDEQLDAYADGFETTVIFPDGNT